MRSNEQGGAAVELTLMAPVLLLLLLLVVELGRFGVARGDVDGAARDASRAASLRRSAGAARTASAQTAEASLRHRGVTCRGSPQVDLSLGPGGFTPGGWVAVEVSCTVELAELSLLRLPGTRTMRARSVAALDTYRGVEDAT